MPKNELLINTEINNYLEHIIKTNLFSNGYIFHGVEGVGKKQTALNFITKIFMKYSSMKNIGEKIINNNHPDFLKVEPTPFTKVKEKKIDSSIQKKHNSEVIKIDQIRKIRNFLSQKSIESEKKIILIIDAHLLNEAASNSLLKILEEPNNGIFILLTSRLNLLLETIRSRCQIVKFNSFSSKEIESYLRSNFDPSKLKILRKFNIQDLVNSSNGSPNKVIDNIEVWNQMSDEIMNKIDLPLKNVTEILKISKLISEELDLYQQTCLVNLLQLLWWGKTKNANIIKDLESLKENLRNNIQPRLSWELNLLKINSEEN